MKQLLPWISVVIIALCIAVVPWFGRAYIPTHDGEYHIVRIVEFSKMLSAGYLFPRWAPDLNSGYGIPIFEFHYPFPNYIGCFLRLFTHDAVYAYQYAVGIGFILAGIFLFLWLKTRFSSFAACIGTIIGIFIPYWFVTQYVRGSIGEVWATAFLFMVLFFGEHKKKIPVALAYAGVILSHNILALMYTPFLFVYWIIRKRYVNCFSMVFGIAVACFFWLPALREGKYVVGLNTVLFSDHFIQVYELLIPSWGTAFSGGTVSGNKMSFQLGIVPMAIILLAVVTMIRERKKEMKYSILYMYLVLVGALCLMFFFSTGVWYLIPIIQFIQYPWRMLSFTLVTIPFLAAYAVSSTKRRFADIILALLAIVLSYSYTRPVQYQARNETYYVTRSNFMDGTSSMGNSFSTIWTPWKDARTEELITVVNGNITGIEKNNYLAKTAHVSLKADGEVIMHTVYFPGWTAFVDGKEQPIAYQNDGIIHVAVPTGEHVITMVFRDTPIRKTASGISIVGLVGLLAWGILSYRGNKQ